MRTIPFVTTGRDRLIVFAPARESLDFPALVEGNMLTREEFQRLYDQGPDAVFEVIHSLQNAAVALAARVKQLEDRLNKDSHNSSKPPSSDGFKKPTSLRPKSNRKSGGQHGHPGRTLDFSDAPDTIVVHRPDVCQDCGAPLAEVAADVTERRQVFDLPPLSLVVTEHQVQTCSCPVCGKANRVGFPESVDQPVQYGPGVRALTTYLMHFELLPYERVVTLMDDLFGAPLSEGTLFTATQQAFRTLAPVEKAVADALAGSKGPVNFDETGQRVGGILHWLLNASTARLTYYKRHRKRGKAALDAMGILSRFAGRAIHDGWGAYSSYGCKHGLCNAHHLRELTALFEQQGQAWAGEMKSLLVEMKEAVEKAKEQGRHRLHPFRECALEARYRAILKAGYKANPPPEPGTRPRVKQGDARCLLLRLDQNRSAVLAFLHDFTVPFDNNQAERDLRMMKVKQKVSGGFRSEEGADAFNRAIRTRSRRT